MFEPNQKLRPDEGPAKMTTLRPSKSNSTFSRRGFLLGAATVGAAVSASPALAAPRSIVSTPWQVARDMRSVNFVHAATGERFAATYYEDGKYLEDALAWADWVLRDVNCDQAIVMNNQLIDLLAHMKHQLGHRDLVVTSAYRTPETNARLRLYNRRAAKNSLHISGMAVDFYSPGVSARRLARIAASERMGGVGMYRGARFIHADVGDVRYWRG